MEQKLDPESIRALVRLMDENALTELAIEEEGCSILLKADGVTQGVVTCVTTQTPAPVTATPAAEDKRARILAPMTGVFYRSSSPSEPPFVEVGDAVEAGQIIGVIEAMKVFSEVPADKSGHVAAIPAKNGDLVQQDEPLIILAEEDVTDAG